MDVPKAFVEEIDFEELQFLEVVGRGAFGVVSRARWRNIDVAVKLIETESEKKAFITELKQLSRVSHPNIVKLYGSCSKQPVCLVMEYAEGGSLYNVLHGSGPQPEYTAAHAMSWMLQCAKGVEYLHSMKPKPLIHRDLKPPNLLLIMGGTVLKICDFGTACDAATHMTNNKGSAAWMAPEVFEGNNYSEKCDVFSWGIILWEVITRKKPFDDIGGPAFRIMWAVHNGTRPPLIKNLPKPLEILMTRCWSQNAVERPPMAEVVRIMSHLNKFFKGGDESLMYPNTPVGGPNLSGTSVMDTPPASNQSQTPPSDYSRGNTIRDTVRRALALQGEPVHVKATTPCAKPVVVEDNKPQGTSAPASLAASHESLDKGSRSSTPSFDMVNKRYSADLSKLQEMDILVHGARMTPAENKPGPARGHRRTGSYGNSPVTSSIDISNAVMTSPNSSTAPAVMHHSTTAPASMGNLVKEQECHMSWTPGSTVNIMPTGLDNQALNLAFIAMDHQLQPLAPSPANPDSMAIFDHHCKLAQEYLRVQTEIALLTQRKHELQRDLEQDEQLQQNSLRFKEEYGQLAIENESLMLLHKNLDKQVRIIREHQQKRYGAA